MEQNKIVVVSGQLVLLASTCIFLDPFLPNANLLILVSKVGTTLEIVAHDSSGGGSKVILSAAFGSKVVKITRVLGDLDFGGEVLGVTVTGQEISSIKCKEQ